MKKILLFTATAVLAWNAMAQQPNANAILQNSNNQFFIENKGQWPEHVLFQTKIGGLNTWITNQGLVYDFYQLEEQTAKSDGKILTGHEERENKPIVKGHGIKLNYLGAQSQQIVVQKGQKLQAYHNYFIGNDPAKWASEVGLYQDVWLKNVYQNIDVHYYYDKGLLRYDFVLHPYANPSDIKLKLEGTDSYYINAKGELVYQTRFGEVTEGSIFAYQEDGSHKKAVACKFKQQGDNISLQLANYDKSKELIIDPLIYSTFLGGSDDDRAYEIKALSNGDFIIAGWALSSGLATTGSYDNSHNGSTDVLVAKFNANGTLAFCTYIGGTDGDDCYGMEIDADNNIYLAGASASTNYPMVSAYDNTPNGAVDVIVSKLSSTGTSLLYSTYLGGSNDDWGYGISLDPFTNYYVCGYTKSSNFPTASALYSSYGGGTTDAFVFKLSSAGTVLNFSTFLGGSVDDYALDIECSGGQVYVTGYTYSSNFPTVSAYQSTIGINYDGFVVRMSENGSSIGYSTFLGGNGLDRLFRITVRNDGVAYVGGVTNSNNFPTTSGCYNNTFNGGTYDGIISAIGFNGNTLVYSTYIGGYFDEAIYALKIDADNNILFGGVTISDNFPVTTNAYDSTFNGAPNIEADAFFGKIEPFAGGSLLYSSYLGGTGDDERVIGIDYSGNTVYLTGRTNSSNFPVTSNAHDNTFSASFDMFVSIIGECPVFNTNVTVNANTITAQEVNVSYQWIDCNNSNQPITGATSQSFTPTQSGSYAVVVSRYGCSDTSACTTITLPSSIIEQATNAQIAIYPNPASHQLFINNIQPGLLQVYSMDGRLMESMNVNTTNYTLNVSRYAQGVYMLRFMGHDGTMYQSKFMKE